MGEKGKIAKEIEQNKSAAIYFLRLLFIKKKKKYIRKVFLQIALRQNGEATLRVKLCAWA